MDYLRASGKLVIKKLLTMLKYMLYILHFLKAHYYKLALMSR